MSLFDKQKNPEKYLKQKERLPWPTEYSGSLLAWLSVSLGVNSYRDETIYTPDDIAHVECFHNGQVVAYEYDARAFDIDFTSSHGVIEQIEHCIYRFVMKDGAIFIVLPSEGANATRLRQIEPVTRPAFLMKGLDKVLSRQ